MNGNLKQFVSLSEGQLIDKLKQFATRPSELYRGFHICELRLHPKGLLVPEQDWDWAKSRASNGEIPISSGGVIYAAPVLIVHYMLEHGYQPRFCVPKSKQTPNRPLHAMATNSI